MLRRRGLGTRLRHLLDLLDGDLTRVYREAGLDYRPRYTPVVRALRELGPSSITALAAHAGVTHSAASQTVTEMKRRRLLRSTRGADARERKISLSPYAEQLLSRLDPYWAATEAAADSLNRELKTSLFAVIEEAISALERRPFRARIHDALRVTASSVGSQGEASHDAARDTRNVGRIDRDLPTSPGIG